MLRSLFIITLAHLCTTAFCHSTQSTEGPHALHARRELTIKLKAYEGIAKTLENKTAVVVFGYNRPDYFEQCIKSLEANPESQTLPFFFILDGGHASRQAAYDRIIRESSIKNKYVIRRTFNYKLHWNLISGLRFMFDWCGFERIIHFEDDVVVTPSYLRLMINFDEWAHKNYSNIGAIQGYRACFMTPQEKQLHLNEIAETSGLWLGYCMRKSVWDDVKDTVYEYEAKFLSGHPWHGKEIKKWMQAKVDRIKPWKWEKTTMWPAPLDPYYKKMVDLPGNTGQSGVMALSFYLKGYFKLCTVVNRAVNIGVYGVNFKAEKWHKWFDGITLDQFPDDATATDFKPLFKFIH